MVVQQMYFPFLGVGPCGGGGGAAWELYTIIRSRLIMTRRGSANTDQKFHSADYRLAYILQIFKKKILTKDFKGLIASI